MHELNDKLLNLLDGLNSIDPCSLQLRHQYAMLLIDAHKLDSGKIDYNLCSLSYVETPIPAHKGDYIVNGPTLHIPETKTDSRDKIKFFIYLTKLMVEKLSQLGFDVTRLGEPCDLRIHLMLV